MGKPVLLLRLEGPLQSWGVRSRWDVRDTGLEPTKSGVIGLLGCARGYPVGDARLEELDAALRFGVRVENAGAVVRDFQTITDFRPATVLSPRSYLEDAAFLAALECRDDAASKVLEECADAVQRPRWPLFLGRKACIPTRPIFAYFGDDFLSIADAFKNYGWEWLGACRQMRGALPNGELAAFIEDEAGELSRQDALRLNASRTYSFRNVARRSFAAVLPDQSTLSADSSGAEVA